MNVAQMKQIFWKEYRTQRSIWLGITLIIVVLQAIVYAMMPQNANNPLETLMGIGAILTTFYALASAGVLFAGEREEETDGWLMILPISRLSLVSGKVLWLLSSWVIAIGLTCFTAYLPYWGMEWGTGKPEYLALSLLRYGGSMVAWGIFFSLLCRHVYSSIAFATIAFLISASMIQFIAGLMDVLTGVAILGSVVIGRQWLTSDQMFLWARWRVRQNRLTLGGAISEPVDSSPGWRMFRRQLWLEWRNARWIALGICLLTLLGNFASFLHLFDNGPPDALLANVLLLPLFFGLMTFRSEHRRDQYRFEGNRGISPLAVWSVKQIVWWGLVSVALSLTGIAAIGSTYDFQQGALRIQGIMATTPVMHHDLVIESESGLLFETVFFAVGIAVLLYASAQTCSLLISRGVSAALVAIMSAVCVLFLVIVTILFNVPRLIAFYLPAFCLLGFCLWQTSRLMSERNETRDWWRTIGVLTTLGLVCGSSWVMWRLTEIAMPGFFAGIVSIVPVFGFFQFSIGGGFLLLFMLTTGLFAFRRKLTAPVVFVLWASMHIVSSLVVSGVTISGSQFEPPTPASLAWVDDEKAEETDKQYRELALRLTSLPQLLIEDEDEGEGPLDQTSEVYSGQRAPSEEQLEWLKTHQSELQQLLRITERPSCDPSDDETFWRSLDKLAPLLRLSAVVAERDNDLESAWEFHLAFLRLQRHALERQTPRMRNRVIGRINYEYRNDLRRWLQHGQQTPERLAQAAEDYATTINQTNRLSQSFLAQSVIQREAISASSLGEWHEGDNYEDFPRRLSQGLYLLPWEAARSHLMLQKIHEHQIDYAEGLNTGQNRKYYEEMASRSMAQQNYYRTGLDGTFPAWLHWYNQGWSQSRSDRLWRLTQNTPLFQASSIENFGEPPYRGEWQLLDELEWIRGQRLFLLGLAFRAVELESGERPQTLIELAERRRDNADVDSILTQAEQLTGEVWNYRTDDYPQNQAENWRYRLYFDPLSDHRFQMSVLERWLN